MADITEHRSSIGGAPEEPSVEILKIKLECIVHLEAHLIEWKVVSIKGDPPRMVGLLEAAPHEFGQPGHHADRMSSVLKTLLEEYCEPF